MAGFRAGAIAAGGFLLWLATVGPLHPYRQALFSQHPPQLILVLGGDVDREHIGVRLGRDLSLPVVVSGGSNPEYAQWLVDEVGIAPKQVHLDYRAQDTLGNFTSLVDDLQLQGIRHVLMVTSEDHLPRSMAVGQVVAGSRGIRLTGVPVECSPDCREEGVRKQLGDWLRAVAWVATGRDLKTLAQQSFPESAEPSEPVVDALSDPAVEVFLSDLAALDQLAH
ncbi:MAG: YdcF family protein [Prochlorococcaceae cyanobacterium ETNP18_MAG_1]|nr:YdcF family protein [Prochlorococcaceae cyanobacterium ETNP18_MAG_1]